MARPLDKTTPIPLHYQLYQELRHLLDEGKLRSEDRMPSESELCSTYDVSRTVVRQALSQLERERRIRKVQGKGSFVAPPPVAFQFAQRLEGMYEDMARRGIILESKVLSNQVKGCPEEVAARLQIEVGAPVVELSRLRHVGSNPIAYVTTWIPAHLCPGLQELDLRHVSLYQTLAQRYGLHLVGGRRRISAVAADDTVAKLLEIRKGSPLISMESISYLKDGTPLEYYTAYHRPDRSVVELDVLPEYAREPSLVSGEGHDDARTSLGRAWTADSS